MILLSSEYAAEKMANGLCGTRGPIANGFGCFATAEPPAETADFTVPATLAAAAAIPATNPPTLLLVLRMTGRAAG